LDISDPINTTQMATLSPPSGRYFPEPLQIRGRFLLAAAYESSASDFKRIYSYDLPDPLQPTLAEPFGFLLADTRDSVLAFERFRNGMFVAPMPTPVTRRATSSC